MFAPKVLAARWLLLCALTFGVVGMHHLASMSHGGAEAAMASGTTVVARGRDDQSHVAPVITQVTSVDSCCGGPDPTSTHNLLHLCLAILAAGLVLGVLLTRPRRSDQDTDLPPRLAPARRQRPPRAPPDSTAVLTSLGVLRL